VSGAKIIRAHVASMYSAFSERFFLCALTSIKQPGTDIPPTSKWTSSKPTQHSTRRKHGEHRARAGADVAELYYSMFLYSLLQSINLVNVGSILWCIFCSFLLVKLCRNILENGLQTKVFTIFLFLQKTTCSVPLSFLTVTHRPTTFACISRATQWTTLQ